MVINKLLESRKSKDHLFVGYHNDQPGAFGPLLMVLI